MYILKLHAVLTEDNPPAIRPAVHQVGISVAGEQLEDIRLMMNGSSNTAAFFNALERMLSDAESRERMVVEINNRVKQEAVDAPTEAPPAKRTKKAKGGAADSSTAVVAESADSGAPAMPADAP